MALLRSKPESALAQAIVDTVREPLLVLDNDFNVIFASRSFCLIFDVSSQKIVGRSIYKLIGGHLKIPSLRELLEKIIPTHSTIEKYEIEADFPSLGKRALILNAREVFFADSGHKLILLAFEDATDRRAVQEKNERLLLSVNELLKQKDMLLHEMRHRVYNSLQIIASILFIKSKTATSKEARQELEDAHRRVLSVATVQKHIQAASRADLIDIAPYLKKLCNSLAVSMIGDDKAISLEVRSDEATVSSAEAVSIGLIVTELVINALKYAFPKGYPDARVLVTYEIAGANWRLVISDNGIGKAVDETTPVKGGLGTALVTALASQLGSKIETENSRHGFKVSVTFSTFDPRVSDIGAKGTYSRRASIKPDMPPKRHPSRRNRR
jgi:PAS domain S-box-containing protein